MGKCKNYFLRLQGLMQLISNIKESQIINHKLMINFFFLFLLDVKINYLFTSQNHKHKMHPNTFHNVKNCEYHETIIKSCMCMIQRSRRIELRDKGLCEIWSRYGKWSECSNACGTGTQVRYRNVITKERQIGERCKPVRGRRQQTRICSGNSCGVTGRFDRQLLPSNHSPPF